MGTGAPCDAAYWICRHARAHARLERAALLKRDRLQRGAYAFRIDRYPLLRIARVTYQGKALREPLAIFWDKRRPLPAYATAFCGMLAEYAREVFPIARSSEPKHGVTTRGRTRRPKKAS